MLSSLPFPLDSMIFLYSPSASLWFVFSDSRSIYRCIFDVFMRGCELSILLLHHLDLLLLESMVLDKCIMTCIHHYGILQSIFTTLKIFCSLPIHLSLP